MSARLAEAWSQETLIPRGREGYRRWRSGLVHGARVVATSRSVSMDAQATASRILGGLAFPSYLGTAGTVYGRVSTLREDTGGWTVTGTAHPDCADCVRGLVHAIAAAASQGQTEGRFEHGVLGDEEVTQHWVTVGRAEQ